jgi:hypothetical protein
MTGGKLVTWVAHPAGSEALKPLSNVWNMLFSSALGVFHRTIALQNHNKLCVLLLIVSFNTEYATNLENTLRIDLHESAEPTEGRVLLLVIPDFVQGLAPCLGKVLQMRSDD